MEHEKGPTVSSKALISLKDFGENGEIRTRDPLIKRG